MNTKKTYEPVEILVEFVESEDQFAATSDINFVTPRSSRALQLFAGGLVIAVLLFLFYQLS